MPCSRIRWTKVIACCFFLAALLISIDASALTVPLPRGGESTFVVEVRNATGIDLPAVAFASPEDPFAQNEYSLAIADSPACELEPSSIWMLRAIELKVTPMNAGAITRCKIHVTRGATSNRPISLVFTPREDVPEGVTLSDSAWWIGPLTNLSIRAEQVEPFPLLGQLDGLARITIHNDGPLDIDSADFGYCQDFGFAPFTIDNAISQGCAPARAGMSCFAVGGPSVQFGIGMLAAGESRSCLLRVTANEPLAGPIGFMLQLAEREYVSDGGVAQDTNYADDLTILRLAPAAAPHVAPVPVPVGDPLYHLILVAIFVGVAALAFHANRVEV